MQPCLCGAGEYDSRKPVFSDGRQNPKAYQPWGSVGINDIRNMMVNPPRVPKSDGHWFIPSSYTEWDGRRFAVQEEKGLFHYIVADVDEGNKSKLEVIDAVRAVVGDGYFLAYETKSSCDPAKNGGKRWRILVPQATPIPGMAYKLVSLSFRELLYTQGGLDTDRSSTRFGQISYLPNMGDYSYDWLESGTSLYDAHADQRLKAVAARLSQELSPGRTSEFDGKKPYTPVWNFNRSVDITDLMLRCGFELEPTGLWHIPGQESKGSLKVYDDEGWTTFSETAASIKMGFSNGNQTQGDAWDIFKCFILRHHPSSMVIPRALQYGYRLPDINYWHPDYAEHFILEAHQETAWHVQNGEYIAYNLSACGDPVGAGAKAAYDQARAEANEKALKEYEQEADKGFSKFTILGPLTGFTEDVATWVNDHFMYYDQPEIAKVAALAAVAAFVGRKDNFDGAMPIFNCLGLAISGTGKNTPNSFLKNIFMELEARYDEFRHGELEVFEPLGPHEGVSSYNRDMSRRLSTVIIYPESGKARNSTAGDRDKVTGAIMQNMVDNAYTKYAFGQQKIALSPVYGAPHSLFEESTPAAFAAHLVKSNAVQSGESARRLFYAFDVSRGNTKRKRNREMPAWMLEGFRRLANEGLRGEEQAMSFIQDDFKCPGSVPVDYTIRQTYMAAPDVAEAFDAMEDSTLGHRRENTANESDLRWNHTNGRNVLLYRQLSLLLARTDDIVNGWNRRTVYMQHLEAAHRLIDASQRTEKANSESFENPLDALAWNILEVMQGIFSKKEPNKKYANACGALSDVTALFKAHKCPWNLLATWTSISKKADALSAGTYTKKKVWDEVKRHGEDLGYWQVEQIGKKLYVCADLTRLRDR